MARFRMLTPILFIALICNLVSIPVQAAGRPPGQDGKRPPQTRYKISYTPLYQAEADLDSGGSFAVDRHLLRFDAAHVVNRQWMVGLGLKFDYERWDFSEVKALAGIDLWDEIYRPGLSVPVFYMPGNNWRFGLIPSVEVAGATGAEAGESLSYGAAGMAAYTIKPGLTIGLRVGDTGRWVSGEPTVPTASGWMTAVQCPTASARWISGHPSPGSDANWASTFAWISTAGPLLTARSSSRTKTPAILGNRTTTRHRLSA